MIDYKSLCQKYPDDSDIADFLAYAQDELRKSRSEDKVELVSDLDKAELQQRTLQHYLVLGFTRMVVVWVPQL